MDAASTAAFALFAAVAAFTPGPNNVMLASSGATFGFLGTVPHILGIIAGFFFWCLPGALALQAFLPPSRLPICCCASLACSFFFTLPGASARPGRPEDRPASRPLSFWHAAAFQMINPKGLTILASAISIYSSGPDSVVDALVVMLPIFMLVTAGSACSWCFFGTVIGRLLKEDRTLRRFNILMALLLVLSLLPMLAE